MVYKWGALIISSAIFAVDSKPIIPVQVNPVTVSIDKIKDSCSEIELSFYVEEPDQVVKLPVGVVGVDGNGLLPSSLHIRKAENSAPLYQKHIREVGSEISLNYKDSPYTVEVNLKETYGKMIGDYVLKFYYFEAPYENVVTSKGLVLGLSQEVVSFSYFLSFDENGCINKFYTGF